MEISQKGLLFIASLEGFKPKPYKNINGVFTIGYGTTQYPNGDHVQLIDKIISEPLALEYLKKHVEVICSMYIHHFILTPVNQSQFDAMCSIIYDLGGGCFIMSSLFKFINTNNRLKDEIAMLRQFTLLGGDIKRREKECKLFLS